MYFTTPTNYLYFVEYIQYLLDRKGMIMNTILLLLLFIICPPLAILWFGCKVFGKLFKFILIGYVVTGIVIYITYVF